MTPFRLGLCAAALLLASAAAQEPAVDTGTRRVLLPRYPHDYDCPPITSLFSSWDDIDGDKRDEPHTGIDAGHLGDTIIAPAAGTVVAVWPADWGWGAEGALMIRHDRADLGLTEGPAVYYSEFDHLRYDEIRHIAVGRKVARGAPLAHVDRPGQDPDNLPEVHWEVWSITDETATVWARNDDGGLYWRNASGRLVDPLYLLSLSAPIPADGGVAIVPFDRGRDYRRFRGFTYILRCAPVRKAR